MSSDTLDAGPPVATLDESEADPTERKRLMHWVRAPGLFRARAAARFAAARWLFETEERERKESRWRQEFRSCSDHSARLLVTDAHGRLRAFFEDGGSDDNAVTLRYFFDARERLRLLYVDYRDIDGGVVQWLIALDARGAIHACNEHVVHRSDAAWPDLCRDEVEEPTRLDPAVRAVVRAQPASRVEPNQERVDLLDLDAASARAACR